MLIRLLALIFVIQSPTLLHARISRGGPLNPRDNISDCEPAVQKEFASINRKRWGKPRVDCNDAGLVSTIYLPSAVGSKKFDVFVREHWRLFDNEGLVLAPVGSREWTQIRRRNGMGYHAGHFDFGERELVGGGKMYYFDLFSAQAIPPTFVVSPKVVRGAAVAQALKAVAKRNHPPNKVEGVELIIRTTCTGTEAPELVWWVRIQEPINSLPVSCFINAETGSACYWNTGPDGCSAYSDVIAL